MRVCVCVWESEKTSEQSNFKTKCNITVYDILETLPKSLHCFLIYYLDYLVILLSLECIGFDDPPFMPKL